MLTELEKKLIASIQEDIAVTDRPYLDIAKSWAYRRRHCLKVFKAFAAGDSFGDLVPPCVTRKQDSPPMPWRPGRLVKIALTKVGNKMASFRQVSHCYRRNPTEGWPYNLYTMIHANDKAACRQTAREMSQAAAVENYKLLFSRRELKKTSMVYFPSDEDD